jgi:hypothetical protein
MPSSASRLHDEAIARGDDGYVDPTTGLFVFTAAYLGSRPCCANGCRHCPWTATGDHADDGAG